MSKMIRVRWAGDAEKLVKISYSTRIQKTDGREARREKHIQTTKSQQFVNHRYQHEKMEMLIYNNLQADDWFVTLTYSDANLPELRTEVQKHVRAFVRRVRKAIQPEKLVYFYCIEGKHSNAIGSNQDHRFHIHICLPGKIPREVLEPLWRLGHVNFHRLIFNTQLTHYELATYMLKDAPEHPGKRGWCASRGLKKSEYDSFVVPDTYDFDVINDAKHVILHDSGRTETVYGQFRSMKVILKDGDIDALINLKGKPRKPSRAAAHGPH